MEWDAVIFLCHQLSPLSFINHVGWLFWLTRWFLWSCFFFFSYCCGANIFFHFILHTQKVLSLDYIGLGEFPDVNIDSLMNNICTEHIAKSEYKVQYVRIFLFNNELKLSTKYQKITVLSSSLHSVGEIAIEISMLAS